MLREEGFDTIGREILLSPEAVLSVNREPCPLASSNAAPTSVAGGHFIVTFTFNVVGLLFFLPSTSGAGLPPERSYVPSAQRSSLIV